MLKDLLRLLQYAQTNLKSCKNTPYVVWYTCTKTIHMLCDAWCRKNVYRINMIIIWGNPLMLCLHQHVSQDEDTFSSNRMLINTSATFLHTSFLLFPVTGWLQLCPTIQETIINIHLLNVQLFCPLQLHSFTHLSCFFQ